MDIAIARSLDVEIHREDECWTLRSLRSLEKLL